MRKSKLLLPRFHRYMESHEWALVNKGNFLYIVSGILNGVALTIMMPAAIALETGDKVWGLAFWSWMIALAVVALLGSIASFFGTSVSYSAGLGFMKTMQVVIGNKVARLPLGWFNAGSAGRLSRMVTQEMVSLGQTVAYFIGQLIRNVAAVVVFCIGAWIWDWHLGLLLTISIPILALFLRAAQACVGKGSSLEDPAEQAVASRIVEFAKCQGALRACHAGSDYPELRDSFHKSRRDSTKGLIWGSVGNFISGAGVQIISLLMIVLAGRLALGGTLKPLQTLVMIGITLRFMEILTDISKALFAMEERREMMNGLDSVLDAKELSLVEKSESKVEDSSVELSAVDFSYIPKQPILKQIDFKVPKDKMFAVVGPSGSGKTTIIKLIARFYDVDSGSIKVGGADVRKLTTEDLFQNVSFVFQDVYLFNDTLKNNILMARPDATDAEVERVSELAGVTEIVKRLPEGWGSICGEGGRALSGGERQRVSIARALLKHAPIVLFDEATSALDAENEANIVRSMEELRKNSTLIVVAHKLETIQMADQIIVLTEDGQIAESGTHQELLAKGGAYKTFWDKRAKSASWKLV